MLINESNPHGGQVYGRKIKADFSVNINPQGAPEKVMEAARRAIELCGQYPDACCSELREAIAAEENIKKEHIICGNGGAELIFQLSAAIRPKKVLIIEPTFCEYRQSAEAQMAEVENYVLREGFDIDEEISDIAETVSRDTDMVFLCNPNNPTGKITSGESVRRLLKKCEETGALLVVDESFGEFTENYRDYSMVSMVEKSKNLLVLKSMTKAYAIPGMRIGYGLCSDDAVLAKMCRMGQCWNVSIEAQKAGTAALKNCREYIEKTLEILRRERKYLNEELRLLGIETFESAANYILIKDREDLKDLLLERDILIRSCDNFVGLGWGYFRIAIKEHDENVILIEALRSVKKGAVCTRQV